MPWIMQMGAFALMLLGLGLAMWVSFWLLLVLFSVGIIMVSWAHIKAFLLARGILNATPGMPPAEGETIQHNESITVIDTDFKRVDSE